MNERGAWLHAAPSFDGAERRLVDELKRQAAPAWIVVPSGRKARELRAVVGEDGPVVVLTMAALLGGGEEAVAGQVPGEVVPALTAEALRGGGSGGIGDVDRFPGVARRVADLLATLKRYGYPTPAELARGLGEIRGGGTSRTARDRQLVDAFEAYQHALSGRLDPADRALRAVQNLEATGAEGEAVVPARVVVTGFHDLDHVQQRAVRALAMAAQRLDLVADEEPGPAAEATRATAVLRRWADGWMTRAPEAEPAQDPPGRAARRSVAAALFTEGAGGVEQADAVELIEADDALAEVCEIARGLAERGAWQDGRRVAVVFPDLGRYAPLVREVFPRYDVPYDLAHGAALLDTPVGASAMAALEFVAEGMPRQGLYDLATAPFLRVRAKAGDLWPGWLDGHAREAGVVGGEGRPEKEWIEPLQLRVALLASTEERQEDAQMLAAQITALRALFRLIAPLRRRGGAPAEALAAAVAQVLEGLGLFARAGIPSEGVPDDLIRQERAALMALQESLQQTPAALTGAGRISARRFVAALRADWGARSVRTAGDPGGVRVLGRLEPRSLEFEELHLGGLSSDRFPGGAVTGGGVLSEADRAALGLPPADRRIDEARHLIYRALLAPTERLTLSWPGREGAKALHPADVVVGLQAVLGQAPRAAPATAVGPVAARLIAGLGEAPHGVGVEEVRRGDGPWSRWEGELGGGEELAARLGPEEHVFSPSQVEAALRCPFAWFSQRVLRLDRAEEEDDDALPAVWGELVHRILARWTLDEAHPATPQARMLRAVKATLGESPWAELQGPFWRAQREGLERGLLQRFLAAETEAARRATHAELRFGPVSGEARDLEDPRSTNTPLTLGDGGSAVRVAGKIDRVDAGAGWVFDYKTGRPPAMSRIGVGPRAGSVQLPIYLLALRRLWGLPVDQATFYELRPDRVGPLSRGWPKRGVEVGQALGEVEAGIVERIADLRAGSMTVVPEGTASCPKRCAYQRMCRVDDRRIATAQRAGQA